MSNKPNKHLILSVDDEPDILRLIERLLSKSGYDVVTAESGSEGLEMIKKLKPSLVLLDIMMPEMDGYEFCSILQKDSATAYIPVVFVTALGGEQNKAKAFAVGAVDYLVKPIRKAELLEKVRKHTKTDDRWKALKQEAGTLYEAIQNADYLQFKEFLFTKLELTPKDKYKYSKTTPSKIYAITRELGISNSRMAQYISEFLNLPYISPVNPESVELGVLPTPFCKSSSIVAVINETTGNDAFVLSNPFDWERLEHLKRFSGLDQKSELLISEPENIDMLFRYETITPSEDLTIVQDKLEIVSPTSEEAEWVSESDAKAAPVVYVANSILDKAVTEKASDIHVLPKEDNTVVRFRIDGDLKDFYNLKRETAIKVISRFKLLGGLDIGERRKPQDGAFAAVLDDRTFSFRLSTTFTPNGESVIIRLLEPYSEPKDLEDLGMTNKQVNTLIDLGGRTGGGLILIVGPTGSGKTTTIYSLLHKVDCETRSLISIEDPVEYRIPFANQQQVHEKAGVTFETLLKAAMRQDPDILFMGEVRDPYSARTSMELASTGHLTMTTLHTSNATTAVFRLERLGIERGSMADTVLAVIAQRLLKKLCPDCKKTVPLSKEEALMLAPFTNELPTQVAHPSGCLQCNNSGYRGREGVYEILKFDADISEMVRTGTPISEIRSFAQERGDYLISNHAVQKVKDLIFAPTDVYEKVLVEEARLKKAKPKKPKEDAPQPPTEKKVAGGTSILVADDNEDTRKLIAKLLKNRGYRVTTSEDGIDALLQLAQKEFDLILSDVNMPNLDGFKLLEMINQKGIRAPVIFLTGRTAAEDERKGLSLGAMDYLKKPIKKDILLLRVKSVLEKLKNG